jgi:hypothetical protein
VDTPESSASPAPTASEDSQRFRRRKRVAAVALSVLVCIQSAAWIFAGTGRRVVLMSWIGGHCYVADLQPRAYVLAIASITRTPMVRPPGKRWLGLIAPASSAFYTDASTALGFGLGSWDDHGYGGNTRYVRIPHYALLAMLVAALLWIVKPFGKRHREGCCRHCGYDLRATPDRCPECGTPAPANAT